MLVALFGGLLGLQEAGVDGARQAGVSGEELLPHDDRVHHRVDPRALVVVASDRFVIWEEAGDVL